MDEQQFFHWIEDKGYHLTNAQKKAVVHDKGPLLLLAVPGAGKTTVLILRLAYLILVKKADPRTILCLTFGRAAAKEMQERFTINLGIPESGNIHFSTIHSFAFAVLRLAFRQRGAAFEIIEDKSGAESKAGVLRGIYEQFNSQIPTDEQLEELQNAICYIKNAQKSPQELKDIPLKNFVNIFKMYEEYKHSHQPRLIDYDDMLSIAYSALKDNPQLLASYQERFHYILTDESQDTSLLQHKIIELLAKPRSNLFVVGDDDQSIFGFRAAAPQYLLNFEKIYPQPNILRMEQNFRSTPQIVDMACQFIRSNKLRFDKEMFTQNPAGETIQIAHFQGEKEQHEFVLKMLKKAKDLSQIAILYRNNLSAISLVEELDRNQIPFYMREASKERFFSHWAVQDILNFLRFSYSDKNIPILEKIWTKFDSHINKSQLAYLQNITVDRSVFDILAEQPNLSPKQVKYYLYLKSQFQKLNKLPPPNALPFIRIQLGYDHAIERICNKLGFSQEYINGLLSILETIAARESTIPEFAKRLSYLEEQIKTSYKNKGSNSVNLSTMHSAKGLEWEQVYMIDLIEGIIPERQTVEKSHEDKGEALEEERRLFYVGMTRAKKCLTLCSLDFYRKQFVQTSRFVREVSLLLNGKKIEEVSKIIQNANDLGVGLVVKHKSFGSGVITEESQETITVRFQDGSFKSFIKEICLKQNLFKAI